MSEFSNSAKWRLVNDFTIYEDRDLNSDRPFMLTCVPKTIEIDIAAFEVVRYIEWPLHSEEGHRPDAYADRSYIKCSGDLHDKIIIFSISQGEIATFRTLTDVAIRQLPVGAPGIGGIYKATVIDGIGYSGMSSHDVPQRGLMEGEPGALRYIAEYEQTPAYLYADLYLDDDKFVQLLASLSNSAKPIRTFKLNLTAELFESEVSASLSEPWMSRDLGLLMKGSSNAYTRARIESISISTNIVALRTSDIVESDGASVDRMEGMENQSPMESVANNNTMLLKYVRYILAAIIVLIVATVLVR